MRIKRVIRMGTGLSGLFTCLSISLAVHALGISVVVYKISNRADIVVEEYATKISLGMVAAKSGPQPMPRTSKTTNPIVQKKPNLAPSPKIKPIQKPKPVPTPKPLPTPKPEPVVKQRQPFTIQPILPLAAPPMQTTNRQEDVPVRIEGATGSNLQSKAKIETGDYKEEGAASARAHHDAHVLRHLKKYKRYPVKAKRRHIEGDVRVRFELNRHGQLISSTITNPAKTEALNRAALLQIKRASPFPRAPNKTIWESRVYEVVIEYTLKVAD